MRSYFTRGLIVGGVIGATIGMMMDPGMVKGRNKKRMMKNGRNMLRKSGDIVNDVIDLFR